MKKLSLKGKNTLKGLHLFFTCIWVGGAVSLVLLNFLSRPASGDEIYATNAAIKLIDDFIIIPGALGSLFTGLLLCWLTPWGFFKFNWINVKWVVTILQILFGTFMLGPWVNGMEALSEAKRFLVLQDATYLHYKQMNLYFGLLQTLVLILVVFISVFKPWGKRGKESGKKAAVANAQPPIYKK